MLRLFKIKTNQREEIIDITDTIEELLKESVIDNGICIVFVMHTSAGIILNEDLDDTVRTDILNTLNKIAPRDSSFKHFHDGNGDSHIKASLIGTSINLIVSNGFILLGQWQRVLFCEFDGPRIRKVYIKILADK